MLSSLILKAIPFFIINTIRMEPQEQQEPQESQEPQPCHVCGAGFNLKLTARNSQLFRDTVSDEDHVMEPQRL